MRMTQKAATLFALGISAALLAAFPAAAADSAAEEVVTEVESVTEEAETAETVQRPSYRALDFVTLGEYKGLTVEVDPINVTDEDVDSEIHEILHSSAEASDILTEGTIVEGDIANIDFVGKKDGVAFDGGTGTGYDLEIGSGTFIPGFEEGLVGVSVGETVDLDVTFPEYYGNEELAGQPAVFTVTVNSIQRLKELDDELASALSDGEAETVADYREWTKGRLAEEALETRSANAKNELMGMAAANITVGEYPQDLVDYTVNEITEYFQYYAAMYGMDFNSFLTAMFGFTEEEFPAQAEDLAKENLKEEFCVDAIAETEGLLPEGEELMAKYDELAATYGYESGEALIAQYGESSLKYSLEYTLVGDFLLENANIVERQPEAEEAAMSAAAATEVEEMADVESTAE